MIFYSSLQVIYTKSSCVRHEFFGATHKTIPSKIEYLGSFNAAVISTTLPHFLWIFNTYLCSSRYLLEFPSFPKVPIKKLQVARFRSYLVFLIAFSESFKYFVKSKMHMTIPPSCISTSNFMRFKLWKFWRLKRIKCHPGTKYLLIFRQNDQKKF